MAISTTLRNQLMDAMLRAVGYTGPATVYISLHTADPGVTGANEVTGGSYARKAVTFAAASNGGAKSSSQVDFTGMPAVTVTHFGIWTAATAGTFMWGGSVSPSKVVNAGDTFQFLSAQIDLSLT